jgi:hypothetical protein
VEVSKFCLELDNGVVGAGNVARAAREDANFRSGVAHRRDHVGMAAHAEIIVRAPDDHFADVAVVMPFRARIGAGIAFEIGEDALAALGFQLADRHVKMGSICVHLLSPVSRFPGRGAAACQNCPTPER